MQIMTQFSMSPQQYIMRFKSLRMERPEKCPQFGIPHSFYGHGCYWRNVLSDDYEGRIPVARFCCKVCALTVFLLPSFVLPYFQYSLKFILTVLSLIFSEIKSGFGMTALFRFYRHRFFLNLTRFEMFLHDQGWSKPFRKGFKNTTNEILFCPNNVTYHQLF